MIINYDVCRFEFGDQHSMCACVLKCVIDKLIGPKTPHTTYNHQRRRYTRLSRGAYTNTRALHFPNGLGQLMGLKPELLRVPELGFITYQANNLPVTLHILIAVCNRYYTI